MQSSNDSPYDTSSAITTVMPDPYLYYGESMKGTFRLGDRLVVAPVSIDTVRTGDVLIYRRAAQQLNASDNIVHRVIGFAPVGLIMRGDSNPGNDIDLVMECDIIGCVTHVSRNGKTYPVHGGTRGNVRGRLLNLRYALPRIVSEFFWQKVAPLPLLRLPYRWLRESGLVLRVWHPPVTKIRLETDEGQLIKYVVHKRTVAQWWPQTDRFWCRKPYDLIITKPNKAP